MVNDICGHHAGDELLKQIAQVYRAEIRERDTLARLGGDEFALIADHCSLADDSFLDYVSDLLDQHAIAPEKLCFEIAEAAINIDMRKSRALIDELRAMGCKVSLISTVTHSVIDEEMVKSVNNIAHLMGKKTIAQRVEGQETADLLTRIGIDYIQGHWIGRPQELASNLR